MKPPKLLPASVRPAQASRAAGVPSGSLGRAAACERLEGRRLLSTVTWDGVGGDDALSTAANWAGDVAPADGDDLVFPAGAARRTVRVDRPGRRFGLVTLGDHDYVLDGAGLGLSSGLTVDAAGAAGAGEQVEVRTPLTLTAPQTFAANADLNVRAPVDLGRHLLTLAGGPGAIRFFSPISGAGGVRNARAADSAETLIGAPGVGHTYTGDTVLDSPSPTRIDGDSTASRLVVNDGTAQVSGSVAGISQTGGELRGAATDAEANVITATGDVELTGGVTRFAIDAPGPAPIVPVHHRIDVTGSVTLGSQLVVEAAGAVRAGQSYTIINNDGTDPVTGTFTFSHMGAAPTPLPDGATLGASGIARLRIDYDGGDGNDVVLRPASVAFMPVSVTVGEAPGPAILTVSRTNFSNGPATVDYATESGTAVAGEDFTPTTGTLTFSETETSKSIFVPIVDDDVNEDALESFRVTLSVPGDPAVAGEGTVFIQDNDGAARISFGAETYTVNEADGAATIDLVRAGDTSGEVTVSFQAGAGSSGSATADADYTPAIGSVTFAPGETRKTFTIPILNDSAAEGNETLRITPTGLTGDAATREPRSPILTIVDDDSAGVLAFDERSIEVAESAGAANVTVIRTGRTDGTVTAQYRTTQPATGGVFPPPDNVAFPGSDYIDTPGTITFGPGETSKAISVPILDDADDEPSQTFVLVLDMPGGGGTIGEYGTEDYANVTILDNDPNDAPTAVDDVAARIAGEAVLIDVTANDGNGDFDRLSLAIATAPAHGTASVDDGGTPLDLGDDRIAYTAAADFAGADSFTYTLDDGRGGSDTATVTVVTGGAAELPDPADPAKTMLVAAGTASRDRVSVVPNRGGGGVQVMLNGRSQGVFNPTGQVILATGAGADRVKVGKLAAPVRIDGGDGDDVIAGTRFNDVLVGGAGDDRITGGAGRDLIVGGAGADRLAGGGDDDILIGSSTDHDAGDAGTGDAGTGDGGTGGGALRELLDAWAADADYAARTAALAAGVGPRALKLVADTVDRDAARDALAGDAGRDLFVAVADPAAEPDLVRGRKQDETIVEV